MKKYLFTLLFLLLISAFNYGQKIVYTIKNQPEIYSYVTDTTKTDLDSLIEFKAFESGFNKNWDIYFSTNKKQPAYTCRLQNDSAIIKHFWRNGQIKQLSIRKKDEDGFYSVYNLELYCSNGLQIEKYNTDTPCALVFTKYYCNGQKKYEMLKDNTCNPTLETEWHDNGEKKTETPYKNGLQEGTAYVWDKTGKMIKKIIWNSGNK